MIVLVNLNMIDESFIYGHNPSVNDLCTGFVRKVLSVGLELWFLLIQTYKNFQELSKYIPPASAYQRVFYESNAAR